MTGLQRLCKLYGSIRVSAEGKSGTWHWNYKTGAPYYVEDKPLRAKKPKAKRKVCANES